jgi:SWI/SNF-related matrix-associated actin-dependent regulator of chromatin subfamily B protein 1
MNFKRVKAVQYGMESTTVAPLDVHADPVVLPAKVLDYDESATSEDIEVPTWLYDAQLKVLRKYPEDQFEMVWRKASLDWKVRCLDCPGRLYAIGPTETLDNFEVHLKNRTHRTK